MDTLRFSIKAEAIRRHTEREHRGYAPQMTAVLRDLLQVVGTGNTPEYVLDQIGFHEIAALDTCTGQNEYVARMLNELRAIVLEGAPA